MSRVAQRRAEAAVAITASALGVATGIVTACGTDAAGGGPPVVPEGGADVSVTDVLSTNDLVTWTCLGQAPTDVRSIGSLNGTVYFGGAEGRIYGYERPSW